MTKDTTKMAFDKMVNSQLYESPDGTQLLIGQKQVSKEFPLADTKQAPLVVDTQSVWPGWQDPKGMLCCGMDVK